MDAENLRALVAVVQPGRARATRAGLGDPAVRRRITSLERELGIPLLVRGSRRTELTPAGAAFLPVAREFLASIDRAQAEGRR